MFTYATHNLVYIFYIPMSNRIGQKVRKYKLEFPVRSSIEIKHLEFKPFNKLLSFKIYYL